MSKASVEDLLHEPPDHEQMYGLKNIQAFKLFECFLLILFFQNFNGICCKSLLPNKFKSSAATNGFFTICDMDKSDFITADELNYCLSFVNNNMSELLNVMDTDNDSKISLQEANYFFSLPMKNDDSSRSFTEVDFIGRFDALIQICTAPINSFEMSS